MFAVWRMVSFLYDDAFTIFMQGIRLGFLRDFYTIFTYELGALHMVIGFRGSSAISGCLVTLDQSFNSSLTSILLLRSECKVNNQVKCMHGRRVQHLRIEQPTMSAAR